MNRVGGVAFREALSLVENGVATVEDVDRGMRYGYGWNIGPFEIADNAGIDTYVRVGNHSPRWVPGTLRRYRL
jgi:3-hydroxybutyryl-CoA dehydrogenase